MPTPNQMTKEDSARIQAAAANNPGGATAQTGFASRAHAAADRNVNNSSSNNSNTGQSAKK